MIARLAFVPAAALALVIGLGVSADAQVARPGWGGNDRSLAYDNGYRRGFEQGQDDARSGRAADYRRDRDYRNGDWGYDRRYGPRDQYQDQFRRGYQVGYADAYDRRGYGYGGNGRAVPRGRDGYSYPGGYVYGRNVASEIGYADGYEKGLEDARKNRRPDVARHRWFRNGDHRYNSRYGPRQAYQIAYREAFRRGYDEGYRDRYQGRYRLGPFGIRIPF